MGEKIIKSLLTDFIKEDYYNKMISSETDNIVDIIKENIAAAIDKCKNITGINIIFSVLQDHASINGTLYIKNIISAKIIFQDICYVEIKSTLPVNKEDISFDVEIIQYENGKRSGFDIYTELNAEEIKEIVKENIHQYIKIYFPELKDNKHVNDFLFQDEYKADDFNEFCKKRSHEVIFNIDNINKQDKEGNTPLHIAIESNLIDICKLLLLKNADPYIKNIYGVSPMEILSKQKQEFIDEFLDAVNEIRNIKT